MFMMRILLAGLYLLLFASLPVSGQISFFGEEPKVFTGGLLLGLNFTQVDGDTYYGYHKVGLNVGGIVYVHFTKSFSASMELLYTQKGSRGEAIIESPAIGTYVTKYFMNLNYVEVPVLLHYTIHRYDIEAGVSYGYLVKSDEWVLADQPVNIDPVANAFNKTDLEYVFGLSAKLYKNLYANARFQYSVGSVRPPERIPYRYGYGNDGQQNNMVSLRLMYLF